ncbi:MAG: signal peptidase I [Actinobacteria bacterium]|nr:MAG: signal peptidase I [Actinomycetota bacterium]
MPDDDLYIGPTALAPGAPSRPDNVARLLIIPLMLVFAALLTIVYVVFNVIAVDGISMAPGILSGDRLLITKGYHTPRRGDIVVFKAPTDQGGTEDIVKRVVAVPGDTVEVRGDVAFINGAEESGYRLYRSQNDPTYVPPTKLAAGTVFVLGDNRPISYDSRMMGPVPTDEILGRAVFIWAPINRMGEVK